ncbi:MAG: hypothetical protein SOV20_08860 [Coriobacteriales bacterium]|nr:hypothetical protein [Coriobacteriales bacterium]
MGPATFGEWVTLGSLLVALIALVANMGRSSKAEHERDQAMRDRLDSIRETVERTQATIDRMDSKLDDHGTRIARVEEQVAALGTRVVRVEHELDVRKGNE